MDYVLEEAVHKTTSLYFDGLISYVTQTHMTADIATIMGLEHRAVQEMCDDMYEEMEKGHV